MKNKEKEKHLSRKELIEMSREKNGKIPEHLKDCPECREAFSLLKAYSVAGSAPLPDAPSGWIDKAISLTRKTGVVQKIRSLVAEIAFDSWQMPQPVGVRGDALEEQRRIRYQAESINFDVRAERLVGKWTFIGQVAGEKTGDSVLKVGKKEVHPDRHGFYQWSSKTPPGQMSLLSSETLIQLPKIKWTKTNPK